MLVVFTIASISRKALRPCHSLQMKWHGNVNTCSLAILVLQNCVREPCRRFHSSSSVRCLIFDERGRSLRGRSGVCVSADAVYCSCDKFPGFQGKLRTSDVFESSFREKLRPSLHPMMHMHGVNGRLPAPVEFSSENSTNVTKPCMSCGINAAHDGLQDSVGGLLNSHSIASNMDDCNGRQPTDNSNLETLQPRAAKRRAFCKRCDKAQDLCICCRFKGVVRNKVKITILQNPKEKQHAVGSVRVALLGLQNVALVDVPEIHTKESFRIRPKVPGSKRSLAGRGGKKLLLSGGKLPLVADDKDLTENEVLRARNLLSDIFQLDEAYLPLPSFRTGNRLPDKLLPNSSLIDMKLSFVGENGKLGVNLEEEIGASDNEGLLCIEELETLIPPGVALLYPSDKAVELPNFLHTNNKNGLETPCHLLVLDGTWSKARRIYFENPWLSSLPHYKLSPAFPSRYEGVRKQPKPGCLSTLESIVYALKVLEPENEEELDGLLEVFNSMVEDQRQCKQVKHYLQKSET